MRKYLTLVIMISCLVLLTGVSQAEAGKTGKIVAVNTNQDTILFQAEQQVKEYKLALNAELKLNGKQVELQALRPINDSNFQQARILLTERGKIKSVAAAYQAVPIIITAIKGRKVAIKNLHTKQVKNYKLNKQIKLIRNNYSTSVADLKVGDQGLAILGIDDQLQKLKVQHYQLSGRVKGINYQEQTITVNCGTRLQPRLKKIKVGNRDKLVSTTGQISLEEIKVNNWLKVNKSKGRKVILSKEL